MKLWSGIMQIWTELIESLLFVIKNFLNYSCLIRDFQKNISIEIENNIDFSPKNGFFFFFSFTKKYETNHHRFQKYIIFSVDFLLKRQLLPIWYFIVRRWNNSSLLRWSSVSEMASETEEVVRRRVAVTEYRRKLLQHKELDSRVRAGSTSNPSSSSFSFIFPSLFFLLTTKSVSNQFQIEIYST